MQRDRTRTRSNEDSRAGAASRGQTNLDFAIGISLFLGVLIFIFLFVPGLLSPFTASAQAQTVTADRAVDHLTKSVLGSPRSPYALRTDCTIQFFDNGTACAFAPAPVAEQLGTGLSHGPLPAPVGRQQRAIDIEKQQSVLHKLDCMRRAGYTRQSQVKSSRLIRRRLPILTILPLLLLGLRFSPGL
jgi:hypothetical protein